MNSMRHFLCTALTLVNISLLVAQESATLSLEGEVLYPRTLTMKYLTSMDSTTLAIKDSDGLGHDFKGVPLAVILEKAGVTMGPELRGENLAKYVLVTAADGYEVLFSLPEIDPLFSQNNVILAYEMDGQPLPQGHGPFRLVVPQDKRHARWIREIRSIKVVFAQ